MTYRIDLVPCINCGLCRRACPTDCIHFFTTGRRTHVIDPDGCIDCGLCVRECPVDCIAYDATYRADTLALEEAKARARAWARRRYAQQQRAHAMAVEVVRRVKDRVPNLSPYRREENERTDSAKTS